MSGNLPRQQAPQTTRTIAKIVQSSTARSAFTDEGYPRSGVEGLSPLQVRARLIENGYSPLPVLAHDSSRREAGKGTLLPGWTALAQFDSALPTFQDARTWDEAFASPGTGIACGAILVVDLDFASDPALATHLEEMTVEELGETSLIRVGQAPKAALFYRAAEPIESKAFKARDGSTDGVDILALKRQIVAFGIHPKTRAPYHWRSGTPLSVPAYHLPLVTRAQLSNLIQRFGGIVDLGKTGGRGKGHNGQTAIVRNVAGKVTDGREIFLTRAIYQVFAQLCEAGEVLDVERIVASAWSRFAAQADLSDGKWTQADARQKAGATLRRFKQGVLSFVQALQPTEPSYPDNSRPLPEAEHAVANGIADFLQVAASEKRSAESICHAFEVETGVGKTQQYIAAIPEAVRKGLSVVVAAPTHQLGDEIATRISKSNAVEARLHRGYDADDPNQPGKKMCHDLAALADAKQAGLGIRTAICEQTLLNDKTVRCPFYGQCGMTQQTEAAPDVWVVPHASLFSMRPSHIPEADVLVIDEGFLGHAIPNEPVRMTLDAMERSNAVIRTSGLLLEEATKARQHSRISLTQALRAHANDGPLEREILLAHGITELTAEIACRTERDQLADTGICPGMDPIERQRLAKAVGAHNMDARAWEGFWAEIRTFLSSREPLSGRLCVRYDNDLTARVFEHRPLRPVHEAWRSHTLLLDATLPEPDDLLAPVLGIPVQVKARIRAHRNEHGHVRQITRAPISASKLGIAKGKDGKPAHDKQVISDLWRLIQQRAACAYPGTVVVIGQKGLVEKLEGRLPPNVDAVHFGAVAGLDRFKDAAGLICIGRPLPDVFAMEMAASVIMGRPAVPAPQNGPIRWYEHSVGGIRLASGEGVAVRHCRHPDPVVEALRWQACEGQLIQAIGRLRALRRSPNSPYFIDIICDVPLPIVADEVVTWQEARPERWADMASEGVILESQTDIQRAFPDLAPTPMTARLIGDLTLVVSSIKRLSIGVTTNVRSYEYKRVGRSPRVRAFVLPNGPDDLKRWLESRLGPITWVHPVACRELQP